MAGEYIRKEQVLLVGNVSFKLMLFVLFIPICGVASCHSNMTNEIGSKSVPCLPMNDLWLFFCHSSCRLRQSYFDPLMSSSLAPTGQVSFLILLSDALGLSIPS